MTQKLWTDYQDYVRPILKGGVHVDSAYEGLKTALTEYGLWFKDKVRQARAQPHE